MTRQAQEVFNQSVHPFLKHFALNLNTGSAAWTEVTNANWHRLLRPIESFFLGVSADITEASTSALTATLIVRNDLEIIEDSWVKDFEALIHAFTNAATVAPGITAELSILYVNPQGIADLLPFYDETLASNAGVQFYKFHFPPKNMSKLLSKGGKLQIVITIIATFAAPSVINLLSASHTDGYMSYLRFLFSSNNTAKDLEQSSEKLPT